MSAFIATRLSTVSSSVSPLLVDEKPMLRLDHIGREALGRDLEVVRCASNSRRTG
jgi:hypothetical protein